MDQRGWPLNQIDEMDIHFYFELQYHFADLQKAPKKRKLNDQKVVPINHVF